MNTKQQRIEFLRKQFQMLGKNRENLEFAANELNNVLSKRRQVVIIKKWSELRSGFRSELLSELRSELWFEFWSELGSELRSELGSELRSELGSESWSEFRSELWSELGSELWSELRFELWSELRSELWSELWSMVFEYYENNWILFINEFYPNLKVLQKNKNKIEAIRKIVEAGNAYIWISKTKLYILPFPEVHLNERKQLHNLNSYALKWLDKETYWIDGVKFDKDLWEKVVQKQLSAIEILKLRNQEQKIVALKIYGWDRILSELKPEILDKKGLLINGEILEHEVLEVRYGDWIGRFLKYVCPSTHKEGLLRVDHRTDETKTVEGARAWGFKPILTFLKADSLEFKKET
jgi:hypothetical protein